MSRVTDFAGRLSRAVGITGQTGATETINDGGPDLYSEPVSPPSPPSDAQIAFEKAVLSHATDEQFASDFVESSFTSSTATAYNVGNIDEGVLRKISKLPLIASILKTRLGQLATYLKPHMSETTAGYVVAPVNSEQEPDTATQSRVYEWLETMGDPNSGDDSFLTFTKRFMRDSLVLDAAAAEIVWLNGLPYSAAAVDAATIRVVPGSTHPYVQVVDGNVRTSYQRHQLVYGVRNPSTDLQQGPYGLSELEILIRVLTGLAAFEGYTAGQLTRGGTTKGILTVEGIQSRTRMRQFTQKFQALFSNAANKWVPPVIRLSTNSKVNWVPLDQSPKDLEFGKSYDLLVRLATAVYGIEPGEVNFHLEGARTIFESSKVEAEAVAQRRGLYPLLMFYEEVLNRGIVRYLAPGYRLRFIHPSDRSRLSLIRAREARSYKTVNEVRRETGDPPIEGGDILLHGNYLRYLTLAGIVGDSSELDDSDLNDPVDDEDPDDSDNLEEPESEQA